MEDDMAKRFVPADEQAEIADFVAEGNPEAEPEVEAPIAVSNVLSWKDTGPAVKELQEALGVEVTGVFDSATRQAVVNVQYTIGRFGSRADGVVDEETAAAIFGE